MPVPLSRQEIKCPLDKFELVFFSLGNTAGAQGKGFPLCPYCYNHPPEFDELQSATVAAEKLALGMADDAARDRAPGGEGGVADGGPVARMGKREYRGMVR